MSNSLQQAIDKSRASTLPEDLQKLVLEAMEERFGKEDDGAEGFTTPSTADFYIDPRRGGADVSSKRDGYGAQSTHHYAPGSGPALYGIAVYVPDPSYTEELVYKALERMSREYRVKPGQCIIEMSQNHYNYMRRATRFYQVINSQYSYYIGAKIIVRPGADCSISVRTY